MLKLPPLGMGDAYMLGVVVMAYIDQITDFVFVASVLRVDLAIASSCIMFLILFPTVLALQLYSAGHGVFGVLRALTQSELLWRYVPVNSVQGQE
jgi:hypothetical protein